MKSMMLGMLLIIIAFFVVGEIGGLGIASKAPKNTLSENASGQKKSPHFTDNTPGKSFKSNQFDRGVRLVEEAIRQFENKVVRQLHELKGHLNSKQSQNNSIGVAMLRGQLNLDLDQKLNSSIELVYVPPAVFAMGRTDEEREDANTLSHSIQHNDSYPRHSVEIANGFFLSKYEITNYQYFKFYEAMKEDLALKIPPQFLLDACELENPVTNISWTEAMDFCRWVSKKTGHLVRLPTEVEWEYAARGRGSMRFARADGLVFKNLEDAKSPGPVGSNKEDVTWCGVHDMCGNVSEWCADLYDRDVYKDAKKTEPIMYIPIDKPRSAIGKEKSVNERVHRGGCFSDLDVNCEAPTRRRKIENDRKKYIGFRVIVVVPKEMFKGK
ncbi:MAG: formylglycine-generating enzyme family protein [Colwellia sp.]|nr:formylglycine-generating enzyme family protein [Colwellia sp.]